MSFDFLEGLGLKPVCHQEEQWFSGVQIGAQLGYANPGKKINALYKRHQDEFTDGMTKLIVIHDDEREVCSTKQHRQIRVFSRRGAYLLIMLARTARAKLMREKILIDLYSVVAEPSTTPGDLPTSSQKEIVGQQRIEA